MTAGGSHDYNGCRCTEAFDESGGQREELELERAWRLGPPPVPAGDRDLRDGLGERCRPGGLRAERPLGGGDLRGRDLGGDDLLQCGGGAGGRLGGMGGLGRLGGTGRGSKTDAAVTS